jgi:signal transduction histidine kinase
MLLGNVAHDIRSPLNMVVGALSLLAEGAFGPLTPDQAEWISKSLGAANHITRLTDDFFDLTKIEMGKLVLYPEETDLNLFLKLLYEIGEGIRWSEGVTFKLDLEPNLPKVMVDPTRIQQVILNLLSNAEKFTSEGSVTLYARKLKDDNKVLIGVSDTGIGIPETDLDLVFDRFKQVLGQKKSSKQGTGLGLSICKELVQLHNGKIWVESQMGFGSDFKFALGTLAS